jgi:hypothetical protein
MRHLHGYFAVLAEIAMMTTMYVLFTLLINAPLLGPLLSAMGLNAVSKEQLHLRKRVMISQLLDKQQSS